MQDNPSLTLALHMADAKYELLSGGAEGGFADVLLGIIAQETCQTYCDNILGVCEFGHAACKQLATDIGESDSPFTKVYIKFVSLNFNTLYHASFIILYYDQHVHNYFPNYNTPTCLGTTGHSTGGKKIITLFYVICFEILI